MRQILASLFITLAMLMAGCQSTPVHAPHAHGYSYHAPVSAHEVQPTLGGVAGAAESTVEAAASVVPMALNLAGHLFHGM